MLHLVFHALIKSVLFLAAGAVIHRTGKTRVEELTGIGKEMPGTIWCFAFASLALIGIPPTSGFISKWYLAAGALDSGTGFCMAGAGGFISKRASDSRVFAADCDERVFSGGRLRLQRMSISKR